MENWLTNTVFSFNWWLLLLSSISLFILWLIILDKKRIIEITAFGLLVGTTGFILDTFGISFVLWSYPDRILPVISSIVEFHHVHLPIIYMLIYQRFNNWKSYFVALIIMSIAFSFVLEPITLWLGIYEIYHWKFIYSFPIYILIGCIIKWLMQKVKQIETNENNALN